MSNDLQKGIQADDTPLEPGDRVTNAYGRFKPKLANRNKTIGVVVEFDGDFVMVQFPGAERPARVARFKLKKVG